MLVVARTIQGAFGALLAPSVLALLTTTFSDPRERGRAFGIYGAIAGAGGALGLLLGGILTSYASWRWTLFINVLFAILALTGSLLWLSNDRAVSREPIDLPGLVLVTGGLFSLVFGFSHAETTTWHDQYTIGFLVAGVVLLGAFAYFETKARHPLLPPRVVLNRTRGGSVLVMLFASVGIFGVSLFLTYYLQGTLEFSPVKTGIAFLPLVGALVVSAQVANQLLLPRVGPRPMIPVGLLISAAGLFGLHSISLHSSYASHVLPYLLVLGLGFGLSVAPAFSTGTLGLAPKDAGVGSATLNTAQQVGGSVGTALLNTIAGDAAVSFLAGKDVTPALIQEALLRSYTSAFLWSALIFCAAAVVAAVVLKKGRLSDLAAQEETAQRNAEVKANVEKHVVRVRVGCRWV
jgi:predicted MFS family arabinose efflux permease